MMYKLFFQVYYSFFFAIHFIPNIYNSFCAHKTCAQTQTHTPGLMQEADERASLHELHDDLDSPS